MRYVRRRSLNRKCLGSCASKSATEFSRTENQRPTPPPEIFRVSFSASFNLQQKSNQQEAEEEKRERAFLRQGYGGQGVLDDARFDVCLEEFLRRHRGFLAECRAPDSSGGFYDEPQTFESKRFEGLFTGSMPRCGS